MEKPFDLDRFVTGVTAYVRLADGSEATVSPAPLAAIGDYFGIVIIKRDERVLDHALFSRAGVLNTGAQMYMKAVRKTGFANVYAVDGGTHRLGSVIRATQGELDVLRDSASRIAVAEVTYEV